MQIRQSLLAFWWLIAISAASQLVVADEGAQLPAAPVPPAQAKDLLAQETATMLEQPSAEVAPGVAVEASHAPADPAVTQALPTPTVVSELPPATAGDEAPKKKPAKPPKPLKFLFFDNDYAYLDAPGNEYFYFGDWMKRRHLGDDLMFSAGGEFRLRQQNEWTILRHDNLLLERTRLFGDVHYSDWLRTYVEAIDATSVWGNTPPKSNEINRFDALNMFGDAKIWDEGAGQAWLRGGRQQLNYGAQRVIGARDWTNDMFTFDGGKAFWRGAAWDLDTFWARPVTLPQHLTHPAAFDAPDGHQEFYGVYATRKDIKDQTFDFYYLRYGNYNGPPAENNTFGTRWLGAADNWLWEAEGAYQSGSCGPRAQSAGFYTLGIGRKLASLPWKPVLWGYYDWASGDKNPNDQVVGTYNQLFPTAHKYFGYMDLIGRQNIEDLNVQLTVNPLPKIELQSWFHVFHLQSARDALYNTSGTKVRQDPTGAAGSDVGQELDITARWMISPRADFYLGYCHFFSGTFLVDTPGGGPPQDFYFTQFAIKF